MFGELFQKQYDFELEQRNSIASATNIPLVAITILASATSALLLDYQYKNTLQCYFFLAFAVITLVSILFSVFCLFRSFWNYEYQKLPTSTSLKQHYQDLHAWHIQNGNHSKDAIENAATDFSSYVEAKLAEAADWNGQNNIVRGNYLHMATVAVAIGVASLIPVGLIHIYNKANSEEKTHQVRVLNLINQPKQEMQMSNQSSGGGNKPVATPAPAPAPAPAPNSKPSGPPNLVFKGNADMVKPNSHNNSPKK